MKAEVDANQERMKACLENKKANQEKTEDITEHYTGATRHQFTAPHGQDSDALHGDPKGVTYERPLGYLNTNLGTSTWPQCCALVIKRYDFYLMRG
jgi:hypothetical protein